MLTCIVGSLQEEVTILAPSASDEISYLSSVSNWKVTIKKKKSACFSHAYTSKHIFKKKKNYLQHALALQHVIPLIGKFPVQEGIA